MRRAAVLLAALAVPSVSTTPAQAAPKVEMMVVGRSAVLRAPKAVTLERARVKVGRRRCAVAAATPLAVLARTSLKLSLRDYGACSRRPADAGGLYVRGVAGQRERGRDGWVYKIGHSAPGSGAGDPASRLRGGNELLWFWCRSGKGGCQRTLVARPERTGVRPGESLRVTVTAYDDDGKGVPAAGATVTLGSATARSGPDGVATLTVGPETGTLKAVATKSRLVRSFGAEVRVG